MREIKLMVSGDTVQANQHRAGVKGSVNATELVVQFDESWDSYSKKIVFWDALEQNPVERSLIVEEKPRTYRTTIPGEPLALAGECVLVIEGWTDTVRMRAMQVRLQVDDVPDAVGASEPVDPTMTQMEQIHVFVENRLQEIRQVGQQVEKAAQDVNDSAEEMLTLARSFDGTVTQVKEDIEQTAEQHKQELESYTANAPTIGVNGNWWLWDGKQYADSEVPVSTPGPVGPQGIQGDTGAQGERGPSGVYLGSGDMPEDCYVQIDPEGEVLNPEDFAWPQGVGIAEVAYNKETWRWETRYTDGCVQDFPGPSPIEGDKFTLHRNSFDSYPVGADTFFKADPRYEYFDANHGDVNSDSYATYGIAEENGSKVLKLRCVNSTTHKFDTMEPVVGEYIVGMDFKLETTLTGSRPGLMVNPFNEYRFDNGSGTITASVRAGDYARITDTATTGSQIVYYVLDNNGKRFIPQENVWYSMQVRVELGRLTLRLWKRGDESTALEVVCETAAIGQRAMEFAKYWAVHTYAPGSASQPVPEAEHTIWLDELEVWRDLTGPAGKDGANGVGIADWRYNPDTWRWEQVYTDGSIKSFPGNSPVDSRFTFFKDDFEGYAAGEDNFLAQTQHWTGTSDSATHLGVVSDDGQRCLKLRVNNSSSRAVAVLNYPISGRATIQFDYKPTPADNSGSYTDLLDIRVVGNSVRAGVNYNNQCFIHTPSGAGPIRDAAGSVLRMNESIWYRVKLIAEVGRVTMKVWKRDTETEPDGTRGGVTVLEHAIVTEELLQAERQLRFEFGPMNYTSTTGEHVAYLDNVMVWRDLWTEADKAEIVSRVLAELEVN